MRWKTRVFLVLAFFAAMGLRNADAAIQCYECHGTSATADYRPNDSAYRNISTGAFKGSHKTHMAEGATAANCAPCHVGSAASYATSHRNGFIDLAGNVNDSPATGVYSKGSSFAQSPNPTLGTCSNVNCHFETVTPSWAVAPLSAPADCDKCHGAAPADGSHPATSGSGKKHGDYYGLTTGSCVKCHPDHISEGSPFAHATSAGKRSLAVTFAAAPNSGFGRYTGNTNYPDYLPSQSPPRNGTCKNLYCHSPGNKASGVDLPNTTATWGGSLTCKGCHKADIASGSVIASGSHQGHVNGMSIGYTQIKCVKCHAATAGSSMTIVNTANHVDKQVTVAFSNTSSASAGSYNGQLATPAAPSVKAPGTAVGQCANVYCHSSGQGNGGTWPPAYQTPTWGTYATGQCGTCHGTQTKHDASGFGYGIATPLTSGSHTKHLSFLLGTGNVSAERKCAACHSYTLTGYSPSACSSSVCHTLMPVKHADYGINVGMPDYYGASASYSGTTKPGDGYGSCSSVYCHSNGLTTSPTYATATWGNAASGACGTCHGVTAAAPPASTPHVKHMGSANPYRFACADCHNGKVQATADSTTAPTFTNLTSHVDKLRNVKFDSTNPFGTYSTATLSCRNLYCHSTGNTSVAAGDLPGVYGGKVYSRITWSGSTTCASCHGRSTANGMPDYANAGAPGSATSNSHGKHVTSSNVQCVECHEKTTKNNTSVRSSVPGYHVNGTNHDVFFNISGLSPSGTYDDAQKKCSATYCHGAGASLAWGGSTYCNSCHSANAGTTGGGGINNWGATPLSAHQLHWEDASALPSKYLNYSTGNLGSAGTYRFACASCHNPASTTHVNGYASGSYRAQVFFGYTSPGKKPTYTYTGTAGTADNGFDWSTGNTACTATYCHSNGAGGVGNTAVSWATTANSATNTRCKSCHSYTTASGALINTNKHGKHADGSTYSFNCAKCHNLTTTDGAAIADKTKHLNKVKNVAWDSLNSDGSAYVNSSTACANIYCHSQGTTFAQPYTGTGKAPITAVTWGGGQTLACNGCHGNTNGYTTGTYRIATPLYESGSPKGNAHASHVDARLATDAGAQCLHCHNSTTTTNTSITTYANHVNEAYSVAGGGTYIDGDNTMNSTGVTVNLNYAASPGASTCSNVSCHPVGVGKVRETSSVSWDNEYRCSDCHNIDMESTSTFHHAMRNYSSSYPLQAPYSSASTGVNAYARRCTMCHVDHTIFSPGLNTSNTLGRAANLRTDIAVAPTASSGYSNKDFIKSSGGTGGICISCHSSAKKKDTTRRRNDYPADTTPVITQAQYSSSGHQYDVSAKFMSDGSTVYGNCSKCHNALLGETSVFMNATSIYSFGNHNSGIRRLQGALDAAGGETAEEQICYRCHSLISDADPGGGPPKAVADRDFYGVAPMSLAAQDIFAANKDFRPANPTYSSTNKLYFKPAAAESPAEPMPNQHNTGDTFTGGTWIGRSMSPWETTTAYETKGQVTNTTGTNYWRMVTFTSPAVYSTTTVPAGSWIINIYCRESSTAQNAKVRYMVYKWNANDTLGTTIITKGTYATELATTAAPGGVRQIAVNVGAVTLSAGEKISVDLELETTSTDTTSYTASFYFGSHAPSDLTLPGSVNWSYADPGAAGYGHPTQHFAGVHLPSTKNESLAYIAQNKHVECVDCHNPHATRNGLHGDYGIATGGSSTTLVNSNKNWVPNQWVGEYVSLVSPTLGTTTPVALITANTATTLTTTPYSGTWVAPVAGDTYRIIANTNEVSRTQRGVSGAGVTYSGAWVNGTYSFVEEATYEYQICFKCHAATDPSTNTMRYWNMTTASLGAARWTNIGLEFNPNNASYHPVLQPLPATGNRRLTAAALTGGWSPGEVMSCSDCHGRDTGTSATAQGPHGSTVKWLLTGKYQNWPFTSAAANGTASGGTLLVGTGTTTYPAENFCFNCHTWAAGGNGHVKSSSGHNRPCVNCHIRVPHGGKVPRLLTGTNVPARYKPDGSGGAFTGSYLTSAQLPATGYMLATSISCSSVCGAKHTDNTTKAYSW